MFYKKLRKKGTHPTPLYLKNRILTFGRMMFWSRADDTLRAADDVLAALGLYHHTRKMKTNPLSPL